MYAHVYLDVLQALLEAGDFPPAILQVTANEILNLFEQGNGLELVLESSNIDTLSIQRKARFSKHFAEGDGESFTRTKCNSGTDARGNRFSLHHPNSPTDM